MAGTHIGGKNDRAFFGAQVGVSGGGSLRLTYYWGKRRGGHSEKRENDLKIAPFLEKGRRRRRRTATRTGYGGLID